MTSDYDRAYYDSLEGVWKDWDTETAPPKFDLQADHEEEKGHELDDGNPLQLADQRALSIVDVAEKLLAIGQVYGDGWIGGVETPRPLHDTPDGSGRR